MTKPRHPEKINKPYNPIKKKPEWIRSKIVDTQTFFKTKAIVNKNNLNTAGYAINSVFTNTLKDNPLANALMHQKN